MSARTILLPALAALLLGACATQAPDVGPPVEPATAWHATESAAGTWRVRWRCEPDPLLFGEDGRILVEAERADGTSASELRVDAGMPQHGHGVVRRARVERLGPGRFAVEDVYLHMPGAWRVYLDLGRDGVFERVELELEVD